MKFEDLQVIWKSQEERPVFTIDADVLRERLEASDRKMSRFFAYEEWFYIIMVAILGIMIISEPILEPHDYHQLPMGAGLLLLSAYLLIHRQRSKKQALDFDRSLVGTVDLSIYRLESYVRWVKRANLLYWLFMIVIGVVTFALHHDSKPIWIWPLMVLFWAFAYIALRVQLNTKRNRIKDLTGLRDKLGNGPL